MRLDVLMNHILVNLDLPFIGLLLLFALLFRTYLQIARRNTNEPNSYIDKGIEMLAPVTSMVTS